MVVLVPDDDYVCCLIENVDDDDDDGYGFTRRCYLYVLYIYIYMLQVIIINNEEEKKYTQFHSEPVQFSFIGNPPQIITTYYIPPASSLSLDRSSSCLMLKQTFYVCVAVLHYFIHYIHYEGMERKEDMHDMKLPYKYATTTHLLQLFSLQKKNAFTWIDVAQKRSKLLHCCKSLVATKCYYLYLYVFIYI